MKRAALMFSGLIAVGTTLGAGSALAAGDYALAFKAADFKSSASVQKLHQRIVRQARQACPNYLASRNLRDIANCRAEVTADLVAQINHPRLNAYVERKGAAEIALAQRDDA